MSQVHCMRHVHPSVFGLWEETAYRLALSAADWRGRGGDKVLYRFYRYDTRRATSLWFAPWVGYHELVKRWEPPLDHTDLEDALMCEVARCYMPIERRKSTAAAGALWNGHELDAANFPALTAFLGDERYADGSARKKGRLGITWGDGKWKVRVSDADAGEVAFRSCDRLEDVLVAAELLLADPQAEWSIDPYADKPRPQGGGGRVRDRR